MHIVTIIGARPQIIKAATVSRAIKEYNTAATGNSLRETIVHTGQHFDPGMSAVFFEQLELPRPDFNMGISSLPHGAMTGRMLEAIESLLVKTKPEMVLVYGDTNSTLAAALAAAKLDIPIAHVEAGLRSGNTSMPEEVNRILTDRVSRILFCPTKHAVDNLHEEGYPFVCSSAGSQYVELVGDVMFDAVLHYRDSIANTVSLESWGVLEKQYVLCTLHRQENTDDLERFEGILEGLSQIARDRRVLLPVHPRTRKLFDQLPGHKKLEGLDLIDPVPYLQMQRLEMGAHAIITDSGGVQKEAFFHGVPCITVRGETEWPETVELGWNRLSGAAPAEILSAYENMGVPPSTGESPYGRGDAATQIVKILCKHGSLI